MVHKKKMVPELRFPEFDGEWELSKIKDHFEFKNGLNKEKEFFGQGTPIINFMDLHRHVHLTANVIQGKVTLSKNEINRYEVKKGDLFFTRTSETIVEIGVAASLVEEIPNCVFSGFVLRARPISSRLDPNFNGYLFSTKSVRKEITTKSSMTTRALTSGTLLNGVEFYYPPTLSEQQKIADFLSAVDQRIQLLQKKKEHLETYKKGVMQQIFSQKIRFKDENGLDFPDWKEMKFGEISTDCSYGLNSSATDFDGIHKYIRITDIDDKSNKFVPSPLSSPSGDIPSKYQLQEGDIVFARTGASVGKSYLYNKNDGNLYFAGFLIKFSFGLHSKFVFYCTQMASYWKWVLKTSMRSGQPGINSVEYKSYKIFLPSLPEQQKITGFLSQIDGNIEQLTSQIESTQAFKKGLLQKMFV